MAATLKGLELWIDRFRDQACPIVVSDANLAEFVEATKDTDLSADQRLVALGSSLQFEDFQDGWRGFSRIFEAARKQAPLNTGVIVVWLISALECWLSEKPAMDIQERILVAKDAESLINELGLGGAYMHGLLNYRHPLRLERDQQFLSEALRWFQIACDASSDEEEATLPRLYSGNCLFELKRYEEALNVFEGVDRSLLSEMNEKKLLQILDQRIAICKSLIS